MSRRVWYVYLFVATAYLLLSLLVPTEAATLERYRITESAADLLRLTIAIPLLAIWFAAFYGYDKFKHYARSIEPSDDGRAFNDIADGLGVLAVFLPVSSILSGITGYVTLDWPQLLPAMTIIRNYTAIVFTLAAFWLLYRGSRRLKRVIANKRVQSRFKDFALMVTTLLTILYTYFIFQNPDRQVPTGDAWRATYYLSDWLILLTIIVPYAFVWLLGFQSVVNIGIYTSGVKGVLYKQILSLLIKGLVGIILISILLQILINFGSLFRSMSLAPLLGIIYLLLAAIAVGYVYVAAGAKRLQKIEEV